VGKFPEMKGDFPHFRNGFSDKRIIFVSQDVGIVFRISNIVFPPEFPAF